MSENLRNLSNDLQGIEGLTIDAIIGITDIVEALHHTINSFSWLLGSPNQDRTSGITGMVYRNIRTITKIVGKTIDILLGQLSSILGKRRASSGQEGVLAALNGVLGDHLVIRNNPLAIPIQFRKNGKRLTEQMLFEAIQQSNGKLLIMVHGSCMNDLLWNRKGHDHGTALASDLGFPVIYLLYNSGLHISENGKRFSDLLEKLITQSNQQIELFFIAHSMGGLVSRSACYYAEISGYSWLKHLQKIVFMGTPHHGSLLEKGGNWINFLMEISPYSKPFSRLGKIRSSGITDLRYGNLVDNDWKGRIRFGLSGDPRTPIPLPKNVDCYSIAATTCKEDANKLYDDLIGDMLVPLSSALGKHKNAEFNLSFPENQKYVARNLNHLDLLNDTKVYEILKNWLKK